MTWSNKGYQVINQGMIQHGSTVKKDTRYDHICQKCHFHTSQVKTEKGWRCKECRTVQKEER